MTKTSEEWPEEKEEQLRELWNTALSAREIGNIVGATKNSVIGKARRLRLPLRELPRVFRRLSDEERAKNLEAKQNRKVALANAPVIERGPEVEIPIQQSPAPKHKAPPRRAVILNFPILQPICCCWPIGHVKDADFHFCGAKNVRGFSYCEEHAQRAFLNWRGSKVAQR